MPDYYGPRDPRDPRSQPDLQAIANMQAVARTDHFIDALAAGAPAPHGDPLAAMLAGWRDEVRRAPDTHVVSLSQASAALGITAQRGPDQRPRSRFALTVAGAVAASVLVLGGFGAVVYTAEPGDALY